MESVSVDGIEEEEEGNARNEKSIAFAEFAELEPRNDGLRAEIENLRAENDDLRSRSLGMEGDLVDLRNQRQEVVKRNGELARAVEEVTSERDALRDELREVEERESELMSEKLDCKGKFEACEDRVLGLVEENGRRVRVFAECLECLRSSKGRLSKIVERIGAVELENGVEEDVPIAEELDLDDELKGFLLEMKLVDNLAMSAERKLMGYLEKMKKEKKELENSLVSLTEENRDINSLLRIALVEKELVEKELNRLKGGGESKRAALLQIAGRGLQKVGFGFMMSSSPTSESSDNVCSKSDSSECEEDAVSLASTVEKIMKNLRLEITKLKRELEDCRSDNERLQSLTEKQAQEIAECTSYMRELEERENMLAQNVEQLMLELTGAEEDIARWREACELEVEAGKNAIEERDREASMLRKELDRTKASLDMMNNKLKLKEELAAAAMAAQEAADKSLRLADTRALMLRERIEELTRQLEETDGKTERQSSRRKVRHICCPWGVLMSQKRRKVPEMEGLLPSRDSLHSS
ncbi:hypothetical protein Scep_006241 [Stephania cephalantha]|uniref:Uncharacterized protein n=1 Tax=Stephania cephalantha TaxID=152367 RepID=A0AAP0K9I3_9MAGN